MIITDLPLDVAGSFFIGMNIGIGGGEGPNRYGGLPVAGDIAPKHSFLSWSPKSSALKQCTALFQHSR